jgi:hypothetical protein
MLVLPSLAITLGLNEALFAQQVWFWCRHYQKAHDLRHYHLGRWWVWNTADEWQVEMPWWSLSTVKRTIHRLRKKRVLLIARFNRMTYDRTNWYAIDRQRIAELTPPSGQNDPMDQLTLTLSTGSERTDGSGQTGTMLPETTRDHQIWSTCLAELKLQTTHSCFDTWLAGTTMTMQDNIATVQCSDHYRSEWLRNRLHPAVERTLRGIAKNPELQIVYLP